MKTPSKILTVILAGALALMIQSSPTRAAVSQAQRDAMNANLAAMNALMESLPLPGMGRAGRMGRMASDDTMFELPPPPTGSWTTNDSDWTQPTNPIPYAYTMQVLGPNDAPILQWMDSQNLIVNCSSNEVCYLSSIGDLTQSNWDIIAVVTNGEAVNIPQTAPAEFFKLSVIQTRVYLQFLPDPAGDYPCEMVYTPEWQFRYGTLYFLTNDITLAPQAYGMYSNTLVEIYYPPSATNASAAWPYVVVSEYYTGTNGGLYVRSNTLTMYPGTTVGFFQPTWALAQIGLPQPRELPSCSMTVLAQYGCCGVNTNYPLTLTNTAVSTLTNTTGFLPAPPSGWTGTNSPINDPTVTNAPVPAPPEAPFPVPSGPGPNPVPNTGSPRPTGPFEGPPPYNQPGILGPTIPCTLFNLENQGWPGIVNTFFPGSIPPNGTATDFPSY